VKFVLRSLLVSGSLLAFKPLPFIKVCYVFLSVMSFFRLAGVKFMMRSLLVTGSLLTLIPLPSIEICCVLFYLRCLSSN
jgi:hypothetical protein